GQEIIKVIVGSGDLCKTFVVHTTLLRKHAPVFFDRIMTNETPDVIRLPNTEPEVFSLYVQYMYTQKLPSKPDSVKPNREDHVHETNLLCKLFALVKFVHDDLAAKDAIDAVYAKAHERSLETQPVLPGSIAVSNIYKATDGPCGARTLMVDLYVWRASGQWIKDQRAGDVPYPTEFLSDLA
ncbi:hypothetical protein C7974DRAFT_282539, partial [Boeremia exigua]|uniref:uncharacterized protein n=1 Tax=Boeremia exigua TaxID=749465 RepID=UPI001E8D3206